MGVMPSDRGPPARPAPDGAAETAASGASSAIVSLGGAARPAEEPKLPRVRAGRRRRSRRALLELPQERRARVTTSAGSPARRATWMP